MGSGSRDLDYFHWDGKRRKFEPMPEEITPAAAHALEFWKAWCDEQEYRLHMSGDQRVLYLVSKKQSHLKRDLGLIEKTAAYVDALLPLPDRDHRVSEEDDPFRENEDPFREGDPGAGRSESSGGRFEWSEDGVPLETETLVLIKTRNVEDYTSCLKRIADAHSYLKEWFETARNMAGFSLARPLCTAWLESADGLEEYNAENELVHRLAGLLILRRFGQQPYWLQTGLSWHVEWELMDSIYCYPYRNEFVFAVEHTAWPGMLSRKHQETEELTMEQFSSWKRGEFQIAFALRAWGMGSFLAREHPEATSAILEDLRILRDHQSKVHDEDGTWNRIVGYECPTADQQVVFERHLGEGYLDRVLEFFHGVQGSRSVKSKVILGR